MVAMPPPLRLAVPSDVLPSLNVTVPPLSNVTEPAVTVAVNVTLWPNTDGLDAEVTVVVVAAWLTVWKKFADVLAAKLLLPP